MTLNLLVRKNSQPAQAGMLARIKKCSIIKLSYNSPKSLLNFANLLKSSNWLNIESFIKKRWIDSQARSYARQNKIFSPP